MSQNTVRGQMTVDIPLDRISWMGTWGPTIPDNPYFKGWVAVGWSDEHGKSHGAIVELADMAPVLFPEEAES